MIIYPVFKIDIVVFGRNFFIAMHPTYHTIEEVIEMFPESNRGIRAKI